MIEFNNEWSSFFHSIPFTQILTIYTGKVLFFFFCYVPADNLNESHIHPSTCSSTLRTSPKSGGFRDISDWLSWISNKLFNSWHVELYT